MVMHSSSVGWACRSGRTAQKAAAWAVTGRFWSSTQSKDWADTWSAVEGNELRVSLSLAPDVSMTGWLLVSYIGLWIGYAALAVLSLVALANLGTVRRSFVALSYELKPTISNLKVGQSLPIARLQTLAGDGLSTSEFRGQSRAFAIVSPTCGAGRTYMRRLASCPGEGRSVELA